MLHFGLLTTVRIAVTLCATLISALLQTAVWAKLPPPTENDKAKATEAAAKGAWTDKVGQYQLCRAQDRTADAYRKSTKDAGKPFPVAAATPACADPGAYVSAANMPAAKPIEASGALSPPGMAVSPPSSTSTSAELTGGKKK